MHNMLALFLVRYPRGKLDVFERIKKRIYNVEFASQEKEQPKFGIFSSPFGDYAKQKKEKIFPGFVIRAMCMYETFACDLFLEGSVGKYNRTIQSG